MRECVFVCVWAARFCFDVRSVRSQVHGLQPFDEFHFVFLKIVTDRKRSDIFMDAMITVIVILYLLKFKPKRFLPSPHVFSKCSPLISKSTTRVKFTLKYSSQMVKNYTIKTSNATVTITTKAQPPCPPPALTACWSVRHSNQQSYPIVISHHDNDVCLHTPFPFLFTCRC